MCMIRPNEERKDLLDRLTPKLSAAFTNYSVGQENKGNYH